MISNAFKEKEQDPIVFRFWESCLLSSLYQDFWKALQEDKQGNSTNGNEGENQNDQ